jgi:asparagine synthetase B (glutamine-hydrolysing)
MASSSALSLSDGLPIAADDDNWTLSLSLEGPDRLPPDTMLWAKRGPISCFLHGELFDREAVLGSADGDWQNDCDADRVLRAYEQLGHASLANLRGSFVVAIIDRSRGVTIVARDPMGSHPLFYAQTGSCVHFAFTPHALLAQPSVSRRFNRAALADHLCLRWPDPHETFFADIRRVPPGWCAVLAEGRLRLERYWFPVPENEPVQWLTTEESECFDGVLDRAVERCLSVGPTGIFLSGGLDSITVAAVASDRARRTGRSLPLALSLEFPDPTCNESAIQSAVARKLELRQHLISVDEAVGSRPLMEQALELNQRLAAPLLNAWLPAYLSLAQRAQREGVRTILTGQGGDEWLSVSPYLAADLIGRGAFLELVWFFGTLRRSYQFSSLALARDSLWSRGVRPLVGRMMHRLVPAHHQARRVARVLAGDPTWLAADPRLREEQRNRTARGLAHSDPPQGFYLRELQTGIDHALVSWELEEQYELGRRTNIRYLHPLLDPDLVQLLYRTPPRALSSGGRTKGLVRATLSRRFPGLGFDRQRKLAATSYFRALILQAGSALIRAAGEFPALSALDVVDGRATRAFVLDALKQPGPGLPKVFYMVNLEMWVRSHMH